jgi:predicted nucleic acid-binding protein
MIVVLDGEAVSAVMRTHRGVQAHLEAALAVRARVVIPTVVLAELASGGSRDAELWRLLKRLPTVDSTPASAMLAGAIRQRAERARRKKRDLTVDSLVAAIALDGAPSTILTGDVDDFRLLVGDAKVRVLRVE